MARVAYEGKRFGAEALDVIARANRILVDYAGQGYDLTLRQLYYQFVARGLITNEERSYKRLGSIVNDARLAGYIDWDHIVDRTRSLRSVAHWDDPADIIDAVSRQYRVSLWDRQSHYVEVWIEKDALVGVIEGVCRELDVPYFSCRGYTSQSEMWAASQRLLRHVVEGKQVKVLHLGDHDPSGIDMSRDIWDRLATFIAFDYCRHQNGGDLDGMSGVNIDATAKEGLDRFEVRRIALMMSQVERYDPPPNPAKLSDSRARDYVSEYGYESWELDALEPSVISALIRSNIEEMIDGDVWDEDVVRQDEEKKLLGLVSREWGSVVEMIEQKG